MLDNFERDEGIRHFQRGIALERVNRINEAVEEYRQAIASYPYLQEAHAALGFFYQRQGLLAKAAEEFRTVAALDGGFLFLFNLGHILVELQRYEEALDVFATCLQQEPGDAATHYEMAFVYYTNKQFPEALAHLQIPRQNYPDDWEVLCLQGKCLLGTRQYDLALAAFEQAYTLANMPQIELEMLDNIIMVERYQEFETLNTLKDKMYAEEGVIYLGSTQDDGLRMQATGDYHFTYPDIATTLNRFMRLQQAYQWNFTALVAVDRLAEPLTLALSRLLHLPICTVDELQPFDTPLLVMAVAREVELLLLTIERSPCPVITFCLGLNWMRHSSVLPDITGIAANGLCSVPWEPELRRLYADRAPVEQREACVQQAFAAVLQAVQETPHNANIVQQVHYYTEHHTRLSFCQQPSVEG
jgi:tetratricopeptide (TPR) repeat protein